MSRGARTDPPFDRQGFSTQLGKLRDEKGWSLRELSRRTGIEAYRLSRIEHARSEPSLGELQLLRVALGARVERLVFGGAPTPYTPEEDIAALERLVARLRGVEEKP